jgi:outer membrane protein
VSENKGDKVKIIVIICLVVIVIGLIITGVVFLRKTEKTSKKIEVGSIDREKVIALDQFKEADEKAEKLKEDYMKKFEEETKKLDEHKKEDAQKIADMRLQYAQDLMKEQEKILKPIYEKAEAAVAVVAMEKKMNTVLDKNIVVCGAEDITDQVIAKLKDNKEIKMPDEAALKEFWSKSKIGYFDKSVVVNLPDFREADKKLAQIGEVAQKKFIADSARMTNEQKEQLYAMMSEELRKVKDDAYAPLFREVSRTVKKVAEAQKLNLVVNKEHVMYGGRNITDEVAKELSGKKAEK